MENITEQSEELRINAKNQIQSALNYLYEKNYSEARDCFKQLHNNLKNSRLSEYISICLSISGKLIWSSFLYPGWVKETNRYERYTIKPIEIAIIMKTNILVIKNPFLSTVLVL